MQGMKGLRDVGLWVKMRLEEEGMNRREREDGCEMERHKAWRFDRCKQFIRGVVAVWPAPDP